MDVKLPEKASWNTDVFCPYMDVKLPKIESGEVGGGQGSRWSEIMKMHIGKKSPCIGTILAKTHHDEAASSFL